VTNEVETRPIRSRRPTAEERFLAANTGEETITEHVTGVDGSGTTFTHKGPKLVVLYRQATWGWESVEVPSSNLTMCLGAGMKVNCGDCGGDCSPDPMRPTPNACPARQKFATRRCPICNKSVFDFGARTAIEMSKDDTDIDDGAYTQATPELRTRSVMDQHIMAFHPADAASLGLSGQDPRLQNPARVPAEVKRS
jgi:hypothetical protein